MNKHPVGSALTNIYLGSISIVATFSPSNVIAAALHFPTSQRFVSISATLVDVRSKTRFP